jgi:Ni/Co efflux regulator RcnB
MAGKVFKPNYLMALAVAAALGLCAGPAFADKPSWAGNGKGGKPDKSYKQDDPRKDGHKKGHDDERREWEHKHGKHFRDHDREVAHNYYRSEYKKHKHCPPGLAKKHNGCVPPGQAKKWHYGRPLPRDVIFYEVPRALVIELPPPPAHYRYVRVASDILLIAVGSGMVIDAIEDLGTL